MDDKIYDLLDELAAAHNKVSDALNALAEAHNAKSAAMTALFAAFEEDADESGELEPEPGPAASRVPRVCCVTCASYDAKSSFCERWQAEPPPEVKATGCPEWALHGDIAMPDPRLQPRPEPAPEPEKPARGKRKAKTKAAPAAEGFADVPF